MRTQCFTAVVFLCITTVSFAFVVPGPKRLDNDLKGAHSQHCAPMERCQRPVSSSPARFKALLEFKSKNSPQCSLRSPLFCTPPERSDTSTFTDNDETLKQELEDELKDSTGWYSYMFPRPLRKVVWAAIGANSAWGALILAGRYSVNGQEAELLNIGGNVALTTFCGVLLFLEFQQEAESKEKRKILRKKQIELGDRQVYSKYDANSGRVRTFSKLKVVNYSLRDSGRLHLTT